MSLEIIRIVNTPINSNCYIIYDDAKSKECVIVDPGSEMNEGLIRILNNLLLKPEFIILTHEHYDHCWGVNNLRCKYSYIKLICSKNCSEAIQNPRSNYSHYYCSPEFSIEPADLLIEEILWRMNWNGYELFFILAKGHSASGIFFRVDKYLFTGDTLIKNLLTITKFRTGSQSELITSLDYLASCKGKNYVVCPGHGDIFGLDDYDLNKALYV